MSRRTLLLVIYVWISIFLVSSENLDISSTNQQEKRTVQRERRQAYSEQYEDEYDINEDKRLKGSSSSNWLSYGNLEEDEGPASFAGLNVLNDYALEDEYSPVDNPDQNVMNDYVIEDDYSLRDSDRQNLMDDYETENNYSLSNDSSNVQPTSGRRFFFLRFMALCTWDKWKRIITPSPPPPPPPPLPRPQHRPPPRTQHPPSPKPKSALLLKSKSPPRPHPRRPPPPPSSSPPPPPTVTQKPQQGRNANITTIQPPTDSINLRTIIKSLNIIYRIRNNILYILGCLLQGPKEFLTEPQYTALYTLFVELRNRPSTFQFIIPHLKNIPKSDLTLQLISIMQILARALPPYLSCAARYWAIELEQKRIDLKSLPRLTCSYDFTILQGVNVDVVMYETGMKPFDVVTVMTELVLGPVFVKILHDIEKYKVACSQELFGVILANFPLIPYDPVLDENIRFIFEITMKRQIISWKEIEIQPITGTPYVFIRNIIKQILVFPNVPRPIKEALSYIRTHLVPVPFSYVNPHYAIMQRVFKYKLDIEFILSFIVPGAFNLEAICLKDRLLGYIKQGQLRESWMITESDGLRYTNPHDLLLAFLAKLQKRIPNQSNEISRTITALLSILIMDKQNKQFSPVVQNIEIFTLLGYFNNPEFGSKVVKIYDNTITGLVSKPEMQIRMSQLIPVEPGKCSIAEVCLKEIFPKLDALNLRIPRQLEKIIIEWNKIIPVKRINSHCKDFSVTKSPIIYYTTRKPPMNPRSEGIDFGNITTNSNKTITNSGNNQVFIGNSKMVNVLMLPPMMSATQQVTIYITDKGAPVLDCPNITSYPGNPKVTMPSLLVILKPPVITNPFGSINPDFKTKILEPLIKISGSTDLTPILGTTVEKLILSGKCPTTAALIVTLLERAKSNPLVQLNRQLLIAINTFLSGMDLFAVITLPIVLRVAKINPKNGILYSIISISEPHKSIIRATAPSNIPQGMLVFVIMDPNKLREPVDPQDPYGSLLPNIGTDTIGGVFIQQLKIIFTKSKIAQLLPDFKPEGYINKGFMLMVILQKLPHVPAIIAKPHLKKIIIGYIWAILIPAFYTKVSYDGVLQVIDEQPQVKPDTSYLFELLPVPKNEQERQLLIVMQQFLERDDLFDILIIRKPTPETSRTELLKMIIDGVLQSRDKFDQLIVDACIYFKSKVFDIKKGSLPIAWQQKEIHISTFRVHLGQLIENVIPYDELSNKNKKAYNSLLEYFRKNPKIFSLIHDFPFKKYKTQGTFLKGLLEFLLNKSIISQNAKKNIKALLPQVILKGPGAKPLEKSGRRSASQLEIEL